MIGVLSLGGCGADGDDRPVVRVSAAASLGPVLEALQPAIEDELGVTVRLNLAGSGTLARQVLDGAPADVAILAHPDWATPLINAGRIDPDGVIEVASNTLVVVGRGPAIELEQLAEPRFARIAIGDHDSVPAGLYAKQALGGADVWYKVESKRVTTADVRAALRYVQTGNVDAAIVYASDSRGLKAPDDEEAIRVLCRIDASLHDPIVIHAGVIDGSADGRRMIDWLRGDTARAALESAGFTPPPRHAPR